MPDLSHILVTFYDYLSTAAFLLVIEPECFSPSGCRVAEKDIRPLESAFDLRILSLLRLQQYWLRSHALILIQLLRLSEFHLAISDISFDIDGSTYDGVVMSDA